MMGDLDETLHRSEGDGCLRRRRPIAPKKLDRSATRRRGGRASVALPGLLCLAHFLRMSIALSPGDKEGGRVHDEPDWNS